MGHVRDVFFDHSSSLCYLTTIMGNALSAVTNPRRRHLGKAIPAEGENGLFSESWFPICLSTSLLPGKVLGVDFLGGRVVAVLTLSGTAQGLSAFCAHLGADLSVGDVDGETLRCAFPHG